MESNENINVEEENIVIADKYDIMLSRNLLEFTNMIKKI